MAAPTAPESTETPATIVTQARVIPEQAETFRRWQQRMNKVVGRQPGFLHRRLLPPRLPDQPDWIIAQRFASSAAARAWLESEARERMLAEIRPALSGADDVHLVVDREASAHAEPVSAMILTAVRPGREMQFKAWRRRIAVCEASFEGYRGYKVQPPIPGVQDDWVTIVRFDTLEHLQAWLDSDERKQLMAEVDRFATGMRAEKVRYGFENWFTFGTESAETHPIWKMNMVVLMMLYPTVFLFNAFVGTPVLAQHSVPWSIALFLANIFSTFTLGYWAVPWASRRLEWWLTPSPLEPRRRVDLAGAALVVVIYGLALAIFSRFP
jgi:antibiotic biosynthesis monooxygenase (ABM) superfamily enzyme